MDKQIQLYLGDNQVILKQIADNSIDAIVTDAPYELGFMGKSWDNTGIAYKVELWKEVLRVLKPGGHLLSFGGSRTYHRMACAIEDAGFEIRDQIMWVYGSGFPKSLNIGKAVDKLQGNKRAVIGSRHRNVKPFDDENGWNKNNTTGNHEYTKGNSEWEGYGTALKPAHEPIVLARKPLSEKTVAENCLKWGVGGLAIDNCRIGHTKDNPPIPQLAQGKTDIKTDNKMYGRNSFNESKTKSTIGGNLLGRFPANLIHDGSEEVVELFPNNSEGCKPHKINSKNKKYDGWGNITNKNGEEVGYTDGNNKSASRFFYCAKTSSSERNKGCEELEVKQTTGGGGMNDPQGDDVCGKYGSVKVPAHNNHPTVKPIALMKYLITLITREGQTVLDPFMGSGSTGVACKLLNRKFIGIELSEEYIKIAQARIKGGDNV